MDLDQYLSDLTKVAEKDTYARMLQQSISTYDSFAVTAMSNIMTYGDFDLPIETERQKIARLSWAMADAMMEERKNRKIT